jgi:capsular exopolysaccharide synthesis family protein
MTAPPGREDENGNPIERWEPAYGAVARETDWTVTGAQGASADLARLQDALKRRFWLVVLGFLPVFGLSVVLTALAPREYESESTFLLQESGRETSASSLELLDRLGRVGQIENEVELLKSRRVVAPTVDALNLHVTAELRGESVRPEEVLESFDATRESVEGTYAVSTDRQLITRVVDLSSERVLVEARAGDTVSVDGLFFVAADSPTSEIVLKVSNFERGVERVRKMVTASRVGREADLIRLTCRTADPVLARDICDDISKRYLELRGELQVTEATNAREFLSDATEQIGARLTVAEDSLAEYAREYGAVSLETRAEEEIRSLAQIRAQRELLKADRDALASYLDQVESGSLGKARYRELANFPTFLENMAVTQLVSSLIELDNRRSELSVVRSPDNPELAAIDDRIAQIETQLLNLASSYKAALDAQIGSYDETLERGSTRLAALPRQQVEYLRRERRVDQLQQVYGMLEGQLREAELAAGVSLPGIRSIDAPQVPLEPSAPSVKLNLLLGMILGLGFGILLALFREFTDSRLRNPEQVELAAGAPVIAMLPTLRASMKELESQPAIEAFRTLVADLKITGIVGNGRAARRSVAVTSSSQGEGKSFTACNLALIWAGTGSRTLLLDADLRAGSVGRFFKMPQGRPGFGDVLRGTAELRDAIQPMPVKEGGTLHVLTAGSRDSEDSVDALHLPGRFADVFEELEADFDFIVVDTPPLNIVSDSTIIAAAADAVLFVVRSGKTRPDELDRAMRRLRRVNRDLVGLVLNDIKLPGYHYYADR